MIDVEQIKKNAIYTIADVSKILAVTTRQVYRYIEKNNLVANINLVTNKKIILGKDLLKFINKSTIKV